MPDENSSPIAAHSPSGTPWRIVVAVALVAALYGFARWFELDAYLERERVRDYVQAAGGWGIVLFVAIFSIGQLLHIPGLVFVAAAMMVYNLAWGMAASLLGALVAVTVSFIVVRTVGGHALAKLETPWVCRVLGYLEARPILTVALLRVVLWMTPTLNYTLALTRLRLRDYVLGSAIGLAGPIIGWSLAFHWMLDTLQ
jgi:uncharacterized membrane protein YdjX (TVP38/TMEM64 family)